MEAEDEVSQLAMNYDMTGEEVKVLSMLRPERENAVQGDALAMALNMNIRDLRRLIKHLIEEHGVCIGSTTVSPAGYYLINDANEVNKTYEVLRHRGISILNRAARLKKISVTAVFGQGEL